VLHKTQNALPRGRIWIKRADGDSVRINDTILGCVGFLAEYLTADESQDAVDLKGSAFAVCVPGVALPNEVFFYFVTARHILKNLSLDRIRILVNKHDGGRDAIKPEEWYFHPDPTVDVAIARYNIPPWVHIRHIQLQMFLTSEIVIKRNIGLGDNVFFPGLFEIIPGEKRNAPLLRHGAIAMIPEHPIQVGSGFSEMLLIEARSVSGISGSPVFVRGTAWIREGYASVDDKTPAPIIVQSTDVYLLGMIWGHWDEDERGVNTGIAAVTPVDKIRETLYRPEAVEKRAAIEATRMRSDSPV
jgi:hypothetical protein